jgi:hypothetical protein
MGILGTDEPKFKDTDGNEVLLNYAYILKDEPEQYEIEHKSDVNGERSFDQNSLHWIYQIRINLFKYDNPEQKYNEIAAYRQNEVYLNVFRFLLINLLNRIK